MVASPTELDEVIEVWDQVTSEIHELRAGQWVAIHSRWACMRGDGPCVCDGPVIVGPTGAEA